MSDTVETKLFIDGAARPASDGGNYDIFNPARPSELVGRAAAGTPDDVEAHQLFAIGRPQRVATDVAPQWFGTIPISTLVFQMLNLGCLSKPLRQSMLLRNKWMTES